MIAKALAQVLSKQYNTLLISLYEEPLSPKSPSISIIKPLTSGLYHIKIYPDQALYEYLSLKVKPQNIIDSIWSKGLFQSLYTIMPGLSDLTRLGKIWYHADQTHGLEEQIFEKIVVDMPSNGFVGRFLSIASLVYDAVKIGPIAKEAKLIKEYFQNKNNAAVHLVTLEEVVVSESIDFYNQLSASGINWGALFINRKFNHANWGSMVLTKGKTPHLFKIWHDFFTRAQKEAQETKNLVDNLGLLSITIDDYLTIENEKLLVNNIAYHISHSMVLTCP
jgi:anion-transporting  ArsA/GET3 family ATPase